MSNNGKFLLGNWQVFPHENRIAKGTLSLTIEPKAMDVFLYLATHAGEVVSTDRLLSHCWEGRFLGDNPVYKIITQLRKALGDSTSQPKYIVTVPKRGYQLIERVKWLDGQNTASGQNVNWQGGSPFRGLQFFDQQHSRVFFGRSRAKSKIIQCLRRSSERDCGFVLLLGQSGCGKSSLLRAGVIPLITQDGGLDGVAASGATIFMPLEPGDREYSKLLIELLIEHGLFPSSENLENIDSKLVDENTCQRFIDENTRPEKSLLLVIDQLEIILNQFKQGVAEVDGFISCLDRLVRSGFILLICAMRNDYYSVFMESSVLERLKSDGEQYDLNPPTSAEIAQMIRYPAEAAGLKFGQLSKTKEKLDDMILADAGSNPDALPLLQYSLQQLYLNRDSKGEMLVSSYQEMGGLYGALANQAEQVYLSLDDSVRAELPRLLHFLIRLAVGNSALVTRQPMNLVKIWSEDCKLLVGAFLNERLIIVERHNQVEQLSITHDALIHHWPRIKQWLEQNQETLELRARLLEASQRWEKENRSADFLLSAGKPIEQAQALLEVPDIYLSNSEKSLIASSLGKVRRFTLLKQSVFFFCVLLSVTAALSAYNANIARNAANHSRAQAEGLISFMLGDLRHRLQEVGRLDILDRIGNKVSDYITDIKSDTFTLDTKLQHIQALKLIGEVRLAQAKNDEAMESFSNAYQQSSQLQQQYPTDQAILALSSELSYWIGYVHYLRGDLSQTEIFWQQYYQGTLQLNELDRERVKWWLELSYALNNLGTLASSNGNFNQAVRKFQESVDWKYKVLSSWPGEEYIVLELADSHSWLGSAYKRMGKLDLAKNEYKTELSVLSQGEQDQSLNFQWQHRTALSLQRSGMLDLELGDIAGSETALKQSRAILARLLDQDETSMDWRWDHANVLFNLGRAYRAQTKDEEATIAFNRVITEMSALLQNDNKVAAWQRTRAKAKIELAIINRTQSRLLVAKQLLTEAIEGLQILQNQVGDGPLLLTELARANIELGRIFHLNNEISAAINAWQRAKSILEPEMDQNEDTTQKLLWVSVLAYLEQWEQLKPAWQKLKSMGYQSPDFIQIDKIIINHQEIQNEFRPN